jgi:hypothetical protein
VEGKDARHTHHAHAHTYIHTYTYLLLIVEQLHHAVEGGGVERAQEALVMLYDEDV